MSWSPPDEIRQKTKVMSRIHDALKRAEKERSIYKGIGIEEAYAPRPIPESPSEDNVSFYPPHQGAAPGGLDPILAQRLLCTWKPDTTTMLFFGSEEPAHGAEEFRTLRSRLYQLRDERTLRKILVTSSLPKEGRSFVTANLAQVLARQPGCRTLLVDGDLRNPSLHMALGTSSTPGLTEFLSGEVEELGIIQRGQMGNLFFIPSGRPVSGQSEIISNGRLKLLLDRLEPLFEWIIIDSPAALPVSDSGLMAKHCDGVVMVVRSNGTPFDIARKTLEKFRPEHLAGVVLNGVPTETQTETERYFRTSQDGPASQETP